MTNILRPTIVSLLVPDDTLKQTSLGTDEKGAIARRQIRRRDCKKFRDFQHSAPALIGTLRPPFWLRKLQPGLISNTSAGFVLPASPLDWWTKQR
jgi:hypothetical protein